MWDRCVLIVFVCIRDGLDRLGNGVRVWESLAFLSCSYSTTGKDDDNDDFFFSVTGHWIGAVLAMVCGDFCSHVRTFSPFLVSFSMWISFRIGYIF